MNNKVTVIMYHYVRELTKSKYPNIKGLDIEKFKSQINYLVNNYTILKMEDFIDAINNKTKLPDNSAILTFDDGYIDHFCQVFPILSNNNIQGSFFVPSRIIKESIVLDVNKIHFILEGCNDIEKLVSYIFSRLDYYRFDYQLNDNSFYYNKLAIPNRFDNKDIIFVKRILQSELNLNLRKIILDEMFLEYFNIKEDIFSKELYMTIDQLKMMKNSGMFIGGHGYNHFWFESLSEIEQIKEIEETILFLNEIGVEKKYRVMCYPYGSYNTTTIKLLNNYNFQCAFTTVPEIANINFNNKLIIPRLDTNDITFN